MADDDVALPRRDGSTRVIHGYGHYHEEYVRTPDGGRIRSTALTRLREDRSVVTGPDTPA